MNDNQALLDIANGVTTLKETKVQLHNRSTVSPFALICNLTPGGVFQRCVANIIKATYSYKYGGKY